MLCGNCSEFFFVKVKWFSEFYFTAKFWSFKLKKPFRMAGGEKKSEPPFFCPPFLSTWKNHPWYYFVKLFCSKGFTTFLPVCKKHTRDAEIRPFCPEFCLKSISFLSFSEKCKNQGSFCKWLIINKVLFLNLTEQGGNIRKRSVFLSALIFVWKIYPQNSYLANLPYGGKKWKRWPFFQLSPKILWSFFHKTASQGLFISIVFIGNKLFGPDFSHDCAADNKHSSDHLA